MNAMAKRFSRLKYALKTLKKPNDPNNDTDAVVAPTGTVLGKFQKSQQSSVRYGERASGSKTQGTVDVAVFAFATGAAAPNKRIKCPMSKRASLSAINGTVAGACNYVVYDAANHNTNGLFVPAKATIFVGTGVKPETASKITGIKYTPRSGNSFTFPIGAEGTKTLLEVRADVKTAATAVNKVSFTNERYP